MQILLSRTTPPPKTEAWHWESPLGVSMRSGIISIYLDQSLSPWFILSEILLTVPKFSTNPANLSTGNDTVYDMFDKIVTAGNAPNAV